MARWCAGEEPEAAAVVLTVVFDCVVVVNVCEWVFRCHRTVHFQPFHSWILQIPKWRAGGLTRRSTLFLHVYTFTLSLSHV